MAKQDVPSSPMTSVWKFFASVRLTVAVLLSLAVTSIIGTVIPQNESPAAYVNAYGEKLYRLFSFLDFFDMYHSWWFQLLMIMLTLNVVVCSLERLPTAWKIVSVKKPVFNPGRFRGDPDRSEFDSGRSAKALLEIYEPYINGKFGYCRTEETENGWVIFGEKGRWTRLGAYIVHLSIIFLLAGGLVGSIMGFEGFVNIPEGQQVDSIRLRNQDAIRPLEFAIRCDDFEVSFYENGAPKEYRSSLTILENDRPTFQKDIIVNDPLRYKGINIFQSSYGSIPSDTVTLSITERESEFAFNFIKKAKVGDTVELPDGKGSFVLEDYLNNATFRGHQIGQAFVGKLLSGDKEPVQVLLPLRFPNFDRMRKGDFVIAVEKYEEMFYTGLQVTHDPGVPMVYLGFVIMILGCFITFFISHQRICVEVVRSKSSCRVMVAGTSNKNKLGMKQKIEKIAEQLRGMS